MTDAAYSQQRAMDILVMVEETGDHSTVLAHVNSMPAPLHGSERPSRDVVTLYGEPTTETIALALAAAVESHRDNDQGNADTIRHLGIWAERGAVGDAAWRDSEGHLVTRDLLIPIEQLHATARQLLDECGQLIRRLTAGLTMPDWPEGARRAISVSLGPIAGVTAPVFAPLEAIVERLREAEGLAFEGDVD
ncbi:MAG TPA: hypothetical protein VIV65_02980 [Gemmatimonadaceae bacterium]